MDKWFTVDQVESIGIILEGINIFRMSWLCVLNPSEDTFETLKPYIQETYEYAKEKFAKRKNK